MRHGWWVPLGGTAFPLVLAVRAGLGVLAGERDADSVTDLGPGGPAITAVPNLVDRIGWMLYSVGFDTALFCAALGSMVLAAACLLPADHAWRPPTAVRRVGGFVGLATTLVGLLVAGAVVLDTYGPVTPLRRALQQASTFDEPGTIYLIAYSFPASDAAAVLVPAAFAALAALVLLRGRRARLT